MTIYEKLLKIQSELKAPKNQYSKFGDYSYRSCEDILEAVKPLLKECGCVLMIPYEPVDIDGWKYICAEATLHDIEENTSISCKGYAREPEDKPKLDSSQVTGSASSYAKKYALNGLFCIDDTKDPDTDEQKKEIKGKQEAEKKVVPQDIDDSALKEQCIKYMKENGISEEKVCKGYKVASVDKLTLSMIKAITDKKNLARFKQECGL